MVSQKPHDHAHGHAVALAAPAEDLCLAFANTRYWRGKPAPTETINNFSDLLTWLETHAVIPSVLLARAPPLATANRVDADRARDQAVAIREAIYALFTAIADGASVPDAALESLNAALAEAPPRTVLIRGAGGFGWAAGDAAPALPTLLAPVLWSAADLLTYAENRRLRRCANEECLWLFMDHSKGGTRRWCDMNSCGNRAKAKRHYLKGKADKGRP